MIKTIARRVGAIALSAGLLGTGMVAAAAPAQAADTMTITGYSLGYTHLSFSASGCKSLPFGLSGSAGQDTLSFTAWTPVYNGNQRVGTVTTSTSSGGRATFKVCPKTAGFGTYKFGATKVSETYRAGSGKATRVFTTKKLKTIPIKAGLKGNLYGKRTGNKLAFTAYVKKFSAAEQRFVNFNSADAYLQYRTPSGGWATKAKLRISGGKGSYVFYTSNYKSYRLYIKPTDWTMSGSTNGLVL